MNDKIEKIRLLCLDVDGVLTDGSIIIDDQKNETKRFHVRDGLAIRVWIRLGFHIAILTAREGKAVQYRASELGISHVIQNATNKLQSFNRLVKQLDLTPDQAAVMGDDLQDMPVMKQAGYPIAVADAVEEVRSIAAYVTSVPGGHGAVREAVEHLLKAKGLWDNALEMFT